MAPQFPLQSEGVHPAEFILSEAAGGRSRDNIFMADPITILPGTPVYKTGAATTDKAATYAKATTGAQCEAITIYGGVSSSGYDLRISIISRDAEINLKSINWPATFDNSAKAAGIAKLATAGIIGRSTGVEPLVT